MHISLTSELESFVKAKVETGMYNNASEVVRDALRFMLMNEELVDTMKLDFLRTKLDDSVAQLERGEGRTKSVSDVIAAHKRSRGSTVVSSGQADD